MLQPSKNLCDRPLDLLQHFTSFFCWGPRIRYPAPDLGKPGRISILLGNLLSGASSLFFPVSSPHKHHFPLLLTPRHASRLALPSVYSRLAWMSASASSRSPWGGASLAGPASRPFPVRGGGCPAPAGRSLCGNDAGNGDQSGEQSGSSRPGFRARPLRPGALGAAPGHGAGQRAGAAGEESDSDSPAQPAPAQPGPSQPTALPGSVFTLSAYPRPSPFPLSL